MVREACEGRCKREPCNNRQLAPVLSRVQHAADAANGQGGPQAQSQRLRSEPLGAATEASPRANLLSLEVCAAKLLGRTRRPSREAMRLPAHVTPAPTSAMLVAMTTLRVPGGAGSKMRVCRGST